MTEFIRTFNEREYGPIIAMIITTVAIACLEIFT
jgi:hypothetical protein